MIDRLAFCWGVSSFYGWGIYGMNLALQLAATRPEITLQCGSRHGADDVVLDPIRERQIAALAAASRPLWSEMAAASVTHRGYPVLRSLMNDLVPGEAAQGGHLVGTPSIGVVFLERATLSAEGRKRADDYALIVTGSSWNERILREQGVTNITTVLQGVDPSIFHPAPKAGLFPGRFVVFSGGKLEFRKGQDIVLSAFHAFHQRHPEALLLTAWHSPWPHLAIELGCPLASDGTPDVVGWAVQRGIPADAIVSIGQTPNIAMPHVIREADVALFPNRCEGGTNLPAMECLACGVPTIVSSNTGHLDLRSFGAMALCHQGAVDCPALDTTGWGESDADECVDELERVHQRWAPDLPPLLHGPSHMPTWHTQIGRLMHEIEKVT